MKKATIWLLTGILLAFSACSGDSDENTQFSSSSEIQTPSSSSILSSSSEIQTPSSSSSSEIQISSSSSETQISSSSLEIQISSSSSSSSSEAEISSSSSTSSSSSSALVSSSSEATSGTFTDERDNKEYKWVKIGELIWMAQNLNYSRTISASGESPCYNNVTINCDKYGRLYGATAKTACPAGWHLPTKVEWQALVDFASPNSGQKLKATEGWSYSSGNGTDEYGFVALPGGRANLIGCEDINTDGYWWSINEEDDERGYVWHIGAGNNASLISTSPQFVQRLYSIRCVKRS